ncbi:hypothetical protein H3146_00040 [Streptomyces sp. OF3]|uniref:Uncharacterized protein n=1 Tax=Streptomyces alkaliterrae TaxID=2213162 RepID=A0A7W3WG60_9ACTN|nr:hypothetical protein [Streptomyces alkaliterrae]MBB1251761.1 hypothetical protein [Streptomyces alkaliterrae]
MAQAGEGPGRREEQLEALRGRMRRAARRKDAERLEVLKGEYADLKAVHVAESHQERREEARARRAARAALERPGPVRWRLPFWRSPLAQERAARAAAADVVQVPASGHLSPWRRGWSPASEVLWRPGS